VTPPGHISDRQGVQKAIDDFMHKLRPEIENFFVTSSHLPLWSPSGTVNEETQRWFKALGIPLVNGEPNLLLYRLLEDYNHHGMVLFNGKKNR
jgi:hypothetical protein